MVQASSRTDLRVRVLDRQCVIMILALTWLELLFVFAYSFHGNQVVYDRVISFRQSGVLDLDH